jgi:hypothetical protein
MFDYLRFWWKLRRVERWRRGTEAKYDKELKEARQRKAMGTELHEIGERAFWENRVYDEEVWQLHTRYLFAEANRLVIPTAEYHAPEAWEEGGTGRYLTLKSLNELRAAVRAEKKFRREAWLTWVPLITALTGLCGVIVGVLSVVGRTPLK